jgi:hypothetical protein
VRLVKILIQYFVKNRTVKILVVVIAKTLLRNSSVSKMTCFNYEVEWMFVKLRT